MKWMLKISFVLFIVSFLARTSVPVSAAGSATLFLSSGNTSVNVGDTFTIDIEEQANNEALDTVRAYVDFPADLLQATDASLGNLFPRTAPGSSIDNVAGEISIGGFTLSDPVNESGTFATLTFTALREGNAQITVLSTSHMISNGEEKIDTNRLNTIEVTIGPRAEEIPAGAGALTITCDSHPDVNVWYKENDVHCTWSVEGGTSDIAMYGVGIDQSPESNPTREVTIEAVIFEQADLGDGVWYLHVKGFHESGVETLTEHYPIRIDTVAPNPILPTASLNQALVGEPVELKFGTTDDGSGVAYYEVAINGGAYVPQINPYVLTDLTEGTYLFQVGAVDYAGNATYGSVSTRVYPQGTELNRPVRRSTANTLSLWKENQWWIIAAGVLILFGLVGTIFKVSRRKKTPSQF